MIPMEIEPGKDYGRFLNESEFYHLYGSRHGDSLEIFRCDSVEGDPLGRAYLTPKGCWWIMWYVFGDSGTGLTEFHSNLVEYTRSHPEYFRT